MLTSRSSLAICVRRGGCSRRGGPYSWNCSASPRMTVDSSSAASDHSGGNRDALVVVAKSKQCRRCRQRYAGGQMDAQERVERKAVTQDRRYRKRYRPKRVGQSVFTIQRVMTERAEKVKEARTGATRPRSSFLV